MSDPNRYNIAASQAQRTLGGNILVVDPNGQLVAYEDYARLLANLTNLKSEADRLKAEVARLTIERNGFEQAMKANQSILETKRDEIERLSAEVARLRKAGDAMAEHIKNDEVVCYNIFDKDEVIDAWNAAKDGNDAE